MTNNEKTAEKFWTVDMVKSANHAYLTHGVYVYEMATNLVLFGVFELGYAKTPAHAQVVVETHIALLEADSETDQPVTPFWKQTHGGMAMVFEHEIYELVLCGGRATVNRGVGAMNPEQPIDDIKLEAQRAVEALIEISQKD